MKSRVNLIQSYIAGVLWLACIFAAPISFAGPQVPFRAEFATEFQSVLEYPLVHVQVAGVGKATHMGKSSAVSGDQVVDLTTGNVTATYTLTAANGDQIVLGLHVHATFVTGGLEISGTWDVLGGTGRFANATGTGAIAGTAVFTGENTGVDHFQLAGTISHPG